MKRNRADTGTITGIAEATAERVRLSGEILKAMAEAMATNRQTQQRFRYAVIHKLTRIEAVLALVQGTERPTKGGGDLWVHGYGRAALERMMRIHRMIGDGEYPNCTKMSVEKRCNGWQNWHVPIVLRRGRVFNLRLPLVYFLGVISAWTSASQAAGATVEEVTPHFSTNVPIVWQAATTNLPKCFWTYKRLPQVFSAAAISNGIVMASFEKKGFPQPSKKDVVLWADHDEGEPRPPDFAILPNDGQLSFSLGDRAPDSSQDIARDDAAVKRALKCAALLGVDPADLWPTNVASAGAYGVFLARQIDGVRFFEDTEGLQVQFGKDGKVRQFALLWPRLERDECRTTASPAEIIRCIRAGKAVVMPEGEERDYFGRAKSLSGASKVTVMRIEPYYSEGRYGVEPPAIERSGYVGPVAQLEALFDVGTNRLAVRLFAPIIATDVRRLLEGENPGKR